MIGGAPFCRGTSRSCCQQCTTNADCPAGGSCVVSHGCTAACGSVTTGNGECVIRFLCSSLWARRAGKLPADWDGRAWRIRGIDLIVWLAAPRAPPLPDAPGRDR
jgi:hypothetical protein